LFRGGIIYKQSSDLERSESCYLRLLTNREIGHIDSVDISISGFKGQHNLASLYLDTNRPEMAVPHFLEAVRQKPDFEASWVGLQEAYRRLGHGDEVRRIDGILGRLASQIDAVAGGGANGIGF